MAELKEEKKEEKKPNKIPAIQFLVRDKTGWRLYNQDTKTGKLYIIENSKPVESIDADIIFAQNGKYFAVMTKDGVQIYKSSKCKPTAFLEHPGVRNVYFSPLNTFLFSYHRPRKEDKTGNFRIWRKNKKEFEVIHQCFISEFDQQKVPFTFTEDELIAANISHNILSIYDAKKLETEGNINKCVIGTIEIENAKHCIFAPVPTLSSKEPQESYLFAVFANATKFKPHTVTIYAYNTVKNEFKQISQRSFWIIDECKLLWDKTVGYEHNLLIVTSSDVDNYGKSYYGRSEVFLMSSTSNKTIAIEIKTKMDDVQWTPFKNEFILIAEHPQNITIYDGKTAEKKYLIGEYSRNIIRFSPCGSFLWCGGFGNLSGEMSFYDYANIENEDGMKGFNKDNSCRYYEWSPDGGLFVTARTYPSRQVDNGFAIYKYNGCKLYEEQNERLYQVAFRPSASGVYPPKTVSKNALAQAKPIPDQEEIAKTRYVAPHLRNKGNKKGKERKLFG